MDIEAKCFNPANITPEHLFRPPTSSTHGELTYLANELSSALEGGDRIKDRRLLVGTELEMFFFTPEIDPFVGSEEYDFNNPNYGENHLKKMDEIRKFAETIQRQRPSEFMDTEKQGRIFFEFHTAPQQVSRHLKTIERFGDLLRIECKRLNILPVLYSQHIHMSLRNNPLNKELCNKEGSDGILPRDSSVRSAFSRVTPLMLLPEEWWDRCCSPHYNMDDGIIPGSRIDDLDHTEFRMLSSEYAFDPVLNLVVSLRAMHAGCVDGSKVSSGEYDSDDYKASVRQMAGDAELANFFGRSTLTKLAGIISQYPDVSERKITVDQIKY